MAQLVSTAEKYRPILACMHKKIAQLSMYHTRSRAIHTHTCTLIHPSLLACARTGAAAHVCMHLKVSAASFLPSCRSCCIIVRPRSAQMEVRHVSAHQQRLLRHNRACLGERRSGTQVAAAVAAPPPSGSPLATRASPTALVPAPPVIRASPAGCCRLRQLWVLWRPGKLRSGPSQGRHRAVPAAMPL